MARKDDVLLAIGSIQADKLARNIEPTYALLSEVRNRLTFDPIVELRQLYKEGIVGFCKTLNQPAFYQNDIKARNRQMVKGAS